MIVRGELRPGERVAQEDVASALGVSVAPVREALRSLEREGQVRYLPRRGYSVTELAIADLEEIYDLRQVLEERAVRRNLPLLDAEDLERVYQAAGDCELADHSGDVAAELEANRRFHFAILERPEDRHSMRLIRLLWDSTEAYRALYYNSAEERRLSNEAHRRIIDSLRVGDPDRVVQELDLHRERALEFLRSMLRTDEKPPTHVSAAAPSESTDPGHG